MTTLELQRSTGKTATYKAGELCFEVTILDSKEAWGQIRYLVTPVSGYGSRWVNHSSLGCKEER